MKIKISICIMTILIFLMFPLRVQAMDYDMGEDTRTTDVVDNYDYSEIQSILNGALSSDNRFDFKEYVTNLVTGKEKISPKGILGDISTAISKEFKGNISILVQLVSIALIAAVFSNFTNVFQNNQISETGFYVTYLLLFTILTGSFYFATEIAAGVLSSVIGFMKALIPTYFLAIAFSSGAGTSMAFYEGTLIIITLVDVLLIKIILPLIRIYFVIHLVNNLSKEDMLSKLADLIALIVRWSLKTLLGIVIGFQTIQGLILPVAENVKRGFVFRVSKGIPGIGNVVESVTETVFGAGILVKNAIGVAGLVVIIVICAIPLVKLCLYTLIYKVGAVLVQPISDKRIINCIHGTAESTRLLLYSVCISMILFLISIGMIAATTSMKIT